ncbi:HD domain-containing protein [Streptomyces iconiensis]|uniref:HD domain-containing protein n=1 Tax=Streptomyces iconiensis TaxID=1384038 RepID=A0ABT6ZND5_9ACTN|nr:HD domain-containing protein [Streptomyces iconiensis]MDJ1130567.1 HD domain-containing protein [Streptomyces iconiensis]
MVEYAVFVLGDVGLEVIDTRIWGKSHGLDRPYPLMGHLVDTAMVAGAVWDAVLSSSRHRAIAGALGVSEDGAGRLVMLWAGLHDLGKILPQFQAAASQEHPLHCLPLRLPSFSVAIMAVTPSVWSRRICETLHRTFPN